MSDYARANSGGSSHFGDKDALSTGDADKVILGAQYDTEFNAIVTAVASKYDSADLASEAQAQAEALNTVLITPLRLANWSDANGGMIGDIHALSDPNDDQLLGWDDSAGAVVGWTDGTGITFSGTSISTNDSEIVHDSLSGFVADEHIAHSGVTLTAGAGLTGGGSIEASFSFAVGAGDGITVNANDVELSSSVAGLGLSYSTGIIAFDPTEFSEIDVVGIDNSEDGILVSDNGVPKILPFDETGVDVIEQAAAQTFALSDASTYQLLTGTTNRTWTIPTNSSVAFKIGATIIVGSRDTATLTISPDLGVSLTSTLENAGTNDRTVVSGGSAVLIKVDTDEWMFSGDVT